MHRLTLKLLAMGCLLLLTTGAEAAFPTLDNAGVFDTILHRFETTAAGWGSKMVSYGSWLFWSLSLLSMVWTYGLMALKKADIQEFFAETIRFFVVTGFFLWLLQNGPAIAMAIIDTLRQVAANASGLSKNISPSNMVDVGFDIASKAIDMSSIWSPALSTVGILIAAIILVVLALVSVNMLLLLISAWLVAYGGIFLLGFGGGRWTQDIAIQYYKTVLGIGVELLTMILIVGVGHSFIDQYYAMMSADMTMKELLVMLVVAIILLALTKKLPPLLAGIVGGGGSGGAGGIGSFGAGAAAGAIGMGAAMAATAGAGVMGAASSLAGGASAIGAAFQAAQQGMAAAGGGGASSSASGGGLAAAMGSAGRFAADMGSHLAKGISETVGDKVDSMKEAAQDRIANTLGGKVASAIENASEERGSSSQDMRSAEASNEAFSEGSLGAGQSDEVALFVHKSTSNDPEA